MIFYKIQFFLKAQNNFLQILIFCSKAPYEIQQKAQVYFLED